MRELIVPAAKEATADVIENLQSEMNRRGSSVKKQMQLNIALEELLINIVHYAYEQGEDGEIRVLYECQKAEDGVYLKIICADRGRAYNPLERTEPDIELPIEEREAGGLGIFMLKNLVDSVAYERKEGENRLTIVKKVV